MTDINKDLEIIKASLDEIDCDLPTDYDPAYPALERVRERIAELEKQVEWISVDDFPYELHDRNILMLFDDETISTGYRCLQTSRFYPDERRILGEKVIGWQRLPAPTKD